MEQDPDIIISVFDSEWRIHASVIIGSDNGLSPGMNQAIFWTSAEILLIRTLGTNCNEILIKWNSCIFIQKHPFENVVCEMAAILPRP